MTQINFAYLFLHVFFCLFIFVHLIKLTIYLNMQKNIAQIRLHKRRSISKTDRSFAVAVFSCQCPKKLQLCNTVNISNFVQTQYAVERRLCELIKARGGLEK